MSNKYKEINPLKDLMSGMFSLSDEEIAARLRKYDYCHVGEMYASLNYIWPYDIDLEDEFEAMWAEDWHRVKGLVDDRKAEIFKELEEEDRWALI